MHGPHDCIVLHYFYYGLNEKTRSLLDEKGHKLFMELTVGPTHDTLDTLLVERKIQNILVRAGIINPMSLLPLAKKRKQ
jgi:hypothetical protein